MNRYRKLLPSVILLFLAILAVLNVRTLYLFQEGNPVAVLIGILRLELGNKDIVLISDSDHKFIARDGSEEPLTKLLADYGWQFVDRFGSGIFCRRNGQTLYVDTRMFTRRYVIYDLEHHPW